jgi:hypothetical protein
MKTKRIHKKYNKKQKQLIKKKTKKQLNKRKTKKQLIKRNNRTRKYLGSGPFDNLAKTVATKVAPKFRSQNALGTAAGVFNTEQKTINGFQKPNQQTLIDSQNRALKDQMKSDMKKTYYKFMNKLDEYTVPPEQHLPMNEYGRYPSFFKKVPEEMRKPGDIEPYINEGEESWKKYKWDKTKEEYFRQSTPDYMKKFYKPSEKKEEDKNEEDTDKFDFGVNVEPGYTEARLKKIHEDDEAIHTPIVKPTYPLAYQIFLSAAKELKINERYTEKVENTIENNIQDANLKEKVIEYNNETKSSDDVGFIGWKQSAFLAKFNLSSPLLNTVIDKTAQGVAIAKSIVVSTYIATHRTIPLGIKTGYGLMDWGLVKSIVSIVNMGFSKDIDWKNPENLDEYNKTLVGILDPVLNTVLKDLLNKGCSEVIPQILGSVINKGTVSLITSGLQEARQEDTKLDNLLDTSNEYCNKIVPVVADFFKKNGFSKGIGEEATLLLSEYNEKAFSLFKSILWDVLRNSWSNTSFDITYSNGEISLDYKIITPASEENDSKLKEYFDEIFKTSSLSSVIKVIVKEANKAFDSIEQVNKEQVDEKIKDSVPEPEIVNEETKIKESFDNTLKDKVSVGDFITNLIPSIEKLLVLWNKEISKQDSNEYNTAVCLLNVVDLRINTLIKETCEIHAKALVGTVIPSEACNEKFYKIASIIYDKPIDKTEVSKEDINYVKGVIKRLTINVILELIKNKSISFKNDFWKSYTRGYIFLNLGLLKILP